MTHPMNWYAGWIMLLVGFITGACMGLGFGREDFFGGYSSWRRRLARLGHIALVALGLLNIVFAISPVTVRPLAGILLIVGGVAMPAVCFLSAWKKAFKRLFFIPVATLLAAVILILLSGLFPKG